MSSYAGSGAYAMGGGFIDFDFIPDPEVIAQELFTIMDNLEDRSAPLALSRQISIEDMREKFASSGPGWAPWAESYEPDALANNLGGILERTLELRDYVTSEGAYSVTFDSVFFSTAGMPGYGWAHEKGALRSSGGLSSEDRTAFAETARSLGMDVTEGFEAGGNVLPKRPFMKLTTEAELQIIQVFDQWFAAVTTIGTSGSGRLFARHAYRGSGGRFARAPL